MTTHTELGPALRAWRERIGPAAVGLPVAGNRRVPAACAVRSWRFWPGISADYLVQLEQGRARNPSRQVLAAFARTLRLNAVERELLYRLAGAVVPPSGTVPRECHPACSA
ncbi:helix-turn-helix domain-containing protein [Streptomyces sp. KL116D]|uniref:helix-turn-helix domain-containing protein n=1 Tax=Streptomyces sp. KL116D TaxID=3045152 RepID=UPI003557A1FF